MVEQAMWENRLVGLQNDFGMIKPLRRKRWLGNILPWLIGCGPQ